MKVTHCDRCRTETAEYWVVSVTYVNRSRREQLPVLELCETCYANRGWRAPEHIALETTDAQSYQTTAHIPNVLRATYLGSDPT